MSELPPDTDEILAISFGEILKGTACVLVSFRVRTTLETGETVEGARDPALLPYQVLQPLLESMPGLFDMMRDQQAIGDVLPPASGPVPAWNAGPTVAAMTPPYTLVAGFGFWADAHPELCAAMAVIEIGYVDRPGEVDSKNYLISHRVLLQLSESLAKVARKMKQKGETGELAGKLH